MATQPKPLVQHESEDSPRPSLPHPEYFLWAPVAFIPLTYLFSSKHPNVFSSACILSLVPLLKIVDLCLRDIARSHPRLVAVFSAGNILQQMVAIHALHQCQLQLIPMLVVGWILCSNLLCYGGYLLATGKPITQGRPLVVHQLRIILMWSFSCHFIISLSTYRLSEDTISPRLRTDPLGTSRALALLCLVLGLYVCFRPPANANPDGADHDQNSSVGYPAELLVTHNVFPAYIGFTYSATSVVLAVALIAMYHASRHLFSASLHLLSLNMRMEVIGGLILPLTMTCLVTLANTPNLTVNWLAESERGASTFLFLFPMIVLLGVTSMNKPLPMILEPTSSFVLFLGGFVFTSIEYQEPLRFARLSGCAVIVVYCGLLAYLFQADPTPEIPVLSLPCV
ncbi:hypothetical protein MIND_00684600 [Mycena indigotica]|uniref:Uncharacterized protein n=1 Tax=Mycena indigotica TaxID=2126181 RepID=A0A8H6W0P4_9AGAR|nr:uncharacterized protein MIND_00684600 [Mycena indigotica]KAF7301199.1 hypothetical protein MIND_00684600 [Mycena indigotica]